MIKKDIYKITFSIMRWAKDLFPFCRSLTGEGNRKTLQYIKQINNNFKIKSFKSGKKVFDWTVPQEWKIDDSFIQDSKGKKLAEFKKNNLHVLNYSAAINKNISFKELKNNIFTNKKKPNSIPYVTSYYKKKWGFSLEYKILKKLKTNEKYLAFIKSKHFNGKMDYAELTIRGKSKKTILICSYICHPSMANNELSGPLVVAALSKLLKPSKYTVKLLLIPETIGAIAYINKHILSLKNNLIAGFNLSCVGDKGPFSLISSINENTYADKIANRVLKKQGYFKKFSFTDRGSNERQFGCQNLDLPFVTICKTRFGDYKEYHTSDDNLKIINEKNLRKSTKCILQIIQEIQKNRIYTKQVLCEPFLTKYKLIHLIGGPKVKNEIENQIQNIIAYVGKDYDVQELSEKLKINKKRLNFILNLIKKKKIVKEYL